MGKIFRFNPLRSRLRKRRIIAILIITLPFWSWLFWYLQKPKVINVMIFDKTVPVLKRNEHRSFNWILTHHKYVKPDKNLYDINQDYKGFFPLEPAKSEKYELHDLENFTETQIDSTAEALDMFYYTDSYGVYYNEWYRHRNETEHSEYIYGGLTDNECTLIEKMVERKKLIISEFNFFASPTPYILRKRMEQLLDLRWTGWTARYFDLLDTVKNPELPRWVVRLYKEQHNYKWPFKKAGIVFVHIDNTIEILENETNLTQETPYIFTNDYAQKKYNLPHSIHYPYWMDITYSGPNNRVISNYKIYPNKKGDSLLRIHNLPKTWPCVIEHLAENDYTYYYFAGDFADNPIRYLSTYFRGVEYLDFLLFNNQPNERTKFFYRYYYPMVKVILKDYYKKLENQRKKKT